MRNRTTSLNDGLTEVVMPAMPSQFKNPTQADKLTVYCQWVNMMIRLSGAIVSIRTPNGRVVIKEIARQDDLYIAIRYLDYDGVLKEAYDVRYVDITICFGG